MTPAMRQALRWLLEHNSDGVFDKNGVLLAAGELAPFMRSTWNKLAAEGQVEFYRVNPLGAQRVRIKSTGEL
jgi:hypothetical protein